MAGGCGEEGDEGMVAAAFGSLRGEGAGLGSGVNGRGQECPVRAALQVA